MVLTNKRILNNKYEIVREIKQGGFGIVYFGVDIQLNKPVAIKEIAPSLVEDAKYLDMFQEEALNIAKLSHNNIVHIYEFSKSHDGRLYIIMEFIDGRDLERIVRVARKTGKRIPQHLAVHITAEICAALDYANHRRDAFTNKPLNLVHQDISPSNIMISRFGGVKLIDFGIATVKRHRSKQRDRKLRGKVPYMAPEQLLMGNHPDHRSDLFSLGLVLNEALTGTRLFRSQEDIITAGKNPKLLRKTLKGQKLPSPLERILLQALEIDLVKRYQSANHMYIDLLQYLISCNETGELTDELAEFIRVLFQQPGATTPSTPLTDPVSSKPSLDLVTRPLVPNRWSGERSAQKPNPLPKTEQIEIPSAAYEIPKTPVDDEDDDDEGDDIKTVIDVIRISARNNKKRILQVIGGVLLTILILGVFDTINGWTRAGIWIYDRLFPPAIEIVTVPPNARILLDDVEIHGRTPMAINEISPGVHKLQLQLDGYRPIVKSLFVPREGQIRVQGENMPDQRSYLFRFNTEISLDSNPQGADVHLNNVQYNQKTPCTITWEVGKPLNIELSRPGFDRLGGYALNTLEGYDVVDDRRFWQMTVSNSSYAKYSITGSLKKELKITTRPSGVEIYDSQTKTLLGVSGGETQISLPAGVHQLELRRTNFDSKQVTVTVDENSDPILTVTLSRRIRFTATDELGSNGRDIGAQIIYLSRGTDNVLRRRSTTPFELALPAESYTAVFQKAGYHTTEQVVSPETRLVRVVMERIKATVQITVIDAVSNQPVPEAEIYYNSLENPGASSNLFARTNGRGEGQGELADGQYQFTVQKRGYRPLNRAVTAQAGIAHTLVFKLYVSN